MHTDKPQLRVVSAVICFISVVLLAACTDDTCEFPDSNPLGKEEIEAATSEIMDKYKECLLGKEETMTNQNAGNKIERTHEVRLKHDPLFWRQPNVHGLAEGWFVDENENLIEPYIWGIKVYVTEKVEQDSLPVEDRIPDCLDGVPVQIVEEGPWVEMTESNMSPELKRAIDVLGKYHDLLWRQPNVFLVNVAFLVDENGKRTETVGIIVRVTKKVDQNTLPRKERIPDCLDGVPVQIVEDEPL